MKVWRTLLIEDEEPARERLKRLLLPYPDFAIVGEAANGIDGLDQTRALQPELIFLDVEMPGLNGFDLLARLEQQPRVIFTTAYDQYAVRAFEENSLDYLLKPIEKERLDKTVKKLQQVEPTGTIPLPLAAMIRQLHEKKELKSLTVKLGDRIFLVKLNEIVYLEADDKYVFLHTIDDRRLLIESKISSLADQLPDSFLRIHRSYIINTDHIREMRKGFNGTLVFYMNGTEGRKLASSRTMNEQMRERFNL
jgi:two-component system LytT family response regulator